jgi:hypothetical protein
MTLRTTKPGRCKHCRERMPEDKPRHVIHDHCIEPFLAALKVKQAAEQKRKELVAARLERAETRRRKAEIKPISKIEEECREIIQKIARIRDRNDGCISCELPASWNGQWHGSHFRSHAAASAVQFHLWNVNKSCWICNKLYSGRINQYEPRLVSKIGQDKVDWLKAQNQIVKRDRSYLERFKKVMGKRLRRMEKRCTAQ